MKKLNNTKLNNLLDAVLLLKNRDEASRFFRDLLTENELVEFSNRWKAARMLDKNISYETIEEETGLSSRTIARVSKWLKQGKNGYKLIIKRINHHNSIPLRKGLH